MYKLAAKLFLVFAFCGWAQRVVAQEYVYKSYNITTVNGLLSNRVSGIYQDEIGFIWLHTQEGVGRFDGHGSKWITKSNSNLRGPIKGTSIVEDAEGYFWLTDGVHIDLFNRKTLNVTPLEEKFPDGVPFASTVHQFWQGRRGGVYIKERYTNEFFYYHPETGFEAIPEFKGAVWITDKKDGLWVTYKGGMHYKYAPNRSQILKSFSIPHHAFWISGYREHEDWFAYFQGNTQEVVIVEALDEGIKEVFRVSTPERVPYVKQLVVYNSVENQLVLNVPHADHRFSIIDLDEKRVIPAVAETSLGNNTFRYTHFIDNRGVYWQQSPRGLQLLKVSKPVFKRYASDLATRGLWADDEKLIIQDKYVSLTNPSQWQWISGRSRIKCTWAANQDELWIGGADGIFQLDPADFSVKEHFSPSEEEGLWAIMRDSKQRWWAGGLYSGLLWKLEQDSVLRYYQQYNGFEKLRSSSIMQLLEDGSNLWAVTNTGLYLLDKEQGVKQHYHSAAKPPSYLPLDNVHFLYKDSSDEYWAATNSDGLVRFRLNEDEVTISSYKQYTSENNLSSNILYAILEDDQERLWISTLHGLSCFDKKTEEVQLFLTEGGLAAAEFNRISYFKDKRGRMYFGSLNGVVGFDPAEVLEATAYNASVHISSLTLHNSKREQRSEQQGAAITEIVLQPGDQFLRLGVSVLDYFRPQQLHYTYKIEGLMKEFQSMSGNVLELGGIPYGKYVLRIRGQSTDKRYAQKDLLLPLQVLRPFYLQWWFILLTFAVTVLGIVQFYFWRIRRLSERKTQLEAMVQERTVQIERDNAIISAQAAQLRELDELKSRFFANVSHELRTPLTLILAPLEGVLKQSTSNNRIFPRLQLMQQNGQRLLRRINELLDLSSLDVNRLGVEETSTQLYSFLRNNLSAFDSMAKLKSIELQLNYQLPESLVLLLDQDKVEKIISNFLSNAIKYTNSGGKVLLHARQLGDQLQLSVADTGIGIAQKDLERIFERFYQVSRSNQQNGSGIGLALCHELASILGGRVWAESEVGKGSVFYFQLPLVESQDIDLGAQSVPVSKVPLPVDVAAAGTIITPLVNRPTILVVEDNVDLRAYLELVLSPNYQVVTAAHGAAALEYLKTQELPALIISDIMMPVMDGMALLAELKQSAQWCAIPIIMLTASQRSEVKLEALRIGVDDYLVKPFKEEELLTRIKNLLRNYQDSAAGEKLTKEVTASDLRWLEELERIMQQHLASPGFKLTEAAMAMNISYRRLQQKLKALTGMTPKRYQRTIKLAKARELLKSGQFETVTEVMYQLGFDNLHYFSKLYKEEFGVKPIEEL
ncbi:MAG: ATP-binding protein [Bacteroidota bacterium]